MYKKTYNFTNSINPDGKNVFNIIMENVAKKKSLLETNPIKDQ